MKTATKRPPLEPALPYAVKLLATRSYTVRKLKDKLKVRGYLPDEIEQAIVKLQEKNLLNDERFAEGFVRTRLESHPRGRMALARDLQARGVAGSLARSVANAAVDNDQEFELARELVERKSGQYAGLDKLTRRRRLTALLARRGFRPDVISKILALPPDEPPLEENA